VNEILHKSGAIVCDDLVFLADFFSRIAPVFCGVGLAIQDFQTRLNGCKCPLEKG